MKKNIKILLASFVAMPVAILPIATKCNITNDNKKNEKENDKNEEFLKEVNTNIAEDIINKNKNNPNFQLLDVRTQGEINEQYIEGMINIDFKKSNFKDEILKLDKNKTYLVYCRTQNRSSEAAKLMHKNGFKYVYWMYGGITQWLKDGKPVVKPKVTNEDITIQSLKNVFSSYNEVKFNILGLKENKQFMATLYGEDKNAIASKEINNVNSEFVLKNVFDAVNIENEKIYTIELKEKTNQKIALFSFKISTIDKDKSYSDYNSQNAYSHINSQSKHDINEKFIQDRFGTNILQYKLFDLDKKESKLFEKIDPSKKTILMFGSTTCGSCLETFTELENLDLSNFNYVKILTSINPNELDESVSNVKDVFTKNKYELSNSFLDASDFIWQKKLNFSTTPKLVILDEFGRLVNASEAFKKEEFFNKFNLLIKNTFNVELKNKNGENAPEIQTPEPNPNPQPEKPQEPEKEWESNRNFTKKTFEEREKDKEFEYHGYYDESGTDIKQIDINKKLYGTDVTNFKVYDYNGDAKKFSEIIPKDNDKPTILLYGKIYCGHCLQRSKEFTQNPFKNANFIDLIDSAGYGQGNYYNILDANGLKEHVDKNIFRPNLYSYDDDWKVLHQNFRFVPRIFILDKNNKVIFTSVETYNISKLLEFLKNTIA
ncbi:rhodanese-like domain-containing protein [Metamycoplasma equirhinis]|uniref:rhodanese-like domain-containing protein n=1 Tax=Metamycoplasma equirhinis TaxID=92402 RepID=UPI003593193C